MKIGCVIPIPDLEKYGYSRVSKTSILNHLRYFDQVVFYSYNNIDSRLLKQIVETNNNNYKIVFDEIPKLRKIDNKDIWNLETACIAAKTAMCHVDKDIDFVLFSTLNHLFDFSRRSEAIKYLSKLKNVDEPFGYYSVAPIIGDVEFYPKASFPYIFNMHHLQDLFFTNDGIYYKRIIYKQSRNSAYKFKVYDIQLEQSLEELFEKNNDYFKKTFELSNGNEKQDLFSESLMVNYFNSKVSQYYYRRKLTGATLFEAQQCYSDDSMINIIDLNKARMRFFGFLKFTLDRFKLSQIV